MTLHQTIDFATLKEANVWLAEADKKGYDMKKVFSRPDHTVFVDYVIPSSEEKTDVIEAEELAG